jgi:hypothetical protein
VLREASRNWPLAELRPADVSSYQALIFRRLGEAPERCKSLCPPNFSVATDLNAGYDLTHKSLDSSLRMFGII